MKAKPKLSFEESLERKRQQNDFTDLPSIDISMWHEDIHFTDDLGDSRYNDCYIDILNDKPGGFDFMLKIFYVASLPMLYLFLEQFFTDLEFSLLYSFGTLMTPCFFAFFFFISYATSRSTAVRFNRILQEVYVASGGGFFYIFEWHTVRPFFNDGPHGGSLEFCVPTPDMALYENIYIKTSYSQIYPVITFSGILDCDDYGVVGSLSRLEFYRRYMEKGFDAVQADPDEVKKGNVRTPSGTGNVYSKSDGFLLWNLRRITKVLEILTGCFWIDWVLRRAASKFEWPEEIERKCSPDQDLSNKNVSVVKPRKDIFYRPLGFIGVELVNRQGDPL